MFRIKVTTAYHFRPTNVILVGGEITGAINKGDRLVSAQNDKEFYLVKGVALLKHNGDQVSTVDIELEPGKYNEQELIGKVLKKVDT